MHAWEIVAVDLDEHSEFDDPRAVDRIGYEVAGSLKTGSVDAACLKMESDLSGYYVVRDGRRLETEPVVDGELQYIRTAAENTPDDPLLDLPSIEEWRSQERLSEL